MFPKRCEDWAVSRFQRDDDRDTFVFFSSPSDPKKAWLYQLVGTLLRYCSRPSFLMAEIWPETASYDAMYYFDGIADDEYVSILIEVEQ